MAYKQVRLGEYFKFEKGLGYKGEFLAEESDVALIGMDSHEEGGGYKEGSEKFYTGPFKPEHIAEVGDVIFAGTEQGFGLLASPLIVPESDKFTTYLFSGDVLRAIPLKPDEFSLEYLYNLYRVERFRKKTAYGDTGTTVRRISHDNFAEQIIPLPDLPTQLAINEVISLMDQQIANNKALSKSLEMLAQATFKSWFIDFDPVQAKSKGEKPFGMDDATAALFPDSMEESEVGFIPKGWIATQLNSILFLHKATVKSGVKTESVPYVPVDQISSKDIFLKNSAPGEYAKTSLVSFEKNDILFGAMRPYFHKVTLAPFDGTTRTTTFVLRPKELDYLAFGLFTVFQEKAIAYATNHAQGSTIPYAVWNNSFENFPTVRPTIEIASAFDRLVLPMMEYGYSLLAENRKLVQIRDAILPRFMSGELQIPEGMLAL